jgi:protein-S-isoprenylcysteine O-methyltransferase Ste14
MAGFLNDIGKFILGEGVSKLKAKVDETIKNVEVRIERATVKVIKTSILFLMMLVGIIFLLVGLAQYLNATVPHLAHGLGTVLVGAILIVLALFVRIMK